MGEMSMVADTDLPRLRQSWERLTRLTQMIPAYGDCTFHLREEVQPSSGQPYYNLLCRYEDSFHSRGEVFAFFWGFFGGIATVNREHGA